MHNRPRTGADETKKKGEIDKERGSGGGKETQKRDK
jgi:hypothetical protein